MIYPIQPICWPSRGPPGAPHLHIFDTNSPHLLYYLYIYGAPTAMAELDNHNRTKLLRNKSEPTLMCVCVCVSS